MDTGICILSMVPVRATPLDKAEMVSQLLFGELVMVTESFGSWLKIMTAYDGYEGWVDRKQVKSLDKEEFELFQRNNNAVVCDLIHKLNNKTTKARLPIVMGSSLPGFSSNSFSISGVEYSINSKYVHVAKARDGSAIIKVALKYMNTPYLWGGRSPFGIDCSGFTQVVLKVCGIKISRDAAQQALQGEPIDFIAEAKAGDLAFFENKENHIIHTGIMLDNQTNIHASGKVHIDGIDHEGIYNQETHRYTHQLRLIRRFI